MPRACGSKACSRRGRHIQHPHQLNHRHREQALLPQDERGHQKTGRLSGRLAKLLIWDAPLTTLAERRHCAGGHLGMDAEVAALGHGWPFAAGPRSNAGVRACRALARHRVVGQSAFAYFWLVRHPALPKVTRCKSGTASSRYRRNGYTPLSKSKVLGDFLRVVAKLVNLSGVCLVASLGLSLKKR